MLLAITPNPAIDRTLVIPGVSLGGVHRAEHVLVTAGGKGLNVARAAHSLHQPLRVCGLLGGLSGQLVARLAHDEGLECVWSWHSAGETRTCTLVVDPQGDDATALNEPGPALPPAAWEQFVAHTLAAAEGTALTTISGSMPPGIAASAMAILLQRLHAAGQRVIVDSSGAALQAALQAAPYGVKVNGSELAAALGRSLATTEQAAQALAELRTRGIELAIVSLGAQGALAASAEGICHACPPALEIVSTIGSGDSLLAGLATGLLRGEGLAAALALGVACGAADALTIGGGLVYQADIARILPGVTVRWW